MPAPIPSRDMEERLLGWVEMLEQVVTEVRLVQESIRGGDNAAGELPGQPPHDAGSSDGT